MSGWGIGHPLRTLKRAVDVHDSLTAVAFWAAVLLPLAYVPLLASGIDTVGRSGLFVSLVVLHLLALRVGHTHRQ